MVSAAHGASLSFLRLLQFSSSVIVFSLLAYMMSSYHFHGSKRTNYVLATGVISTFYTMCVFFLTAIVPGLVYIGVYFLFEVVMCCMWVAAFIVDAKNIGEHSCHLYRTSTYNPRYGSRERFDEYDGQYDPYTKKYTDREHKRACHSGKASIAFAGLSWLLFFISSIVLGVYVMRPITKNYGGAGLMKSGASMGVSLHRTSGLALNGTPGGEYGMGAATEDPNAADNSTINSQEAAEKINEAPRASGATAV